MRDDEPRPVWMSPLITHPVFAHQYPSHQVMIAPCRQLGAGCSRGGRRRVEDMCYERRRAEACVDESAHHALGPVRNPVLQLEHRVRLFPCVFIFTGTYAEPIFGYLVPTVMYMSKRSISWSHDKLLRFHSVGTHCDQRIEYFAAFRNSLGTSGATVQIQAFTCTL
jgi:hypothetical protein